MDVKKQSRLRDTRKPRHGWFDYEVFDVFGDELGQNGISVYVTLARLCYGSYRVQLGLREMAAHARMSKDTFSRALKKVIELGLVIEHKGRTAQSASDYDLVDVKELVAESLRKSVSRRDTFAAPFTASTPRPSEPFGHSKSGVNQGDSAVPMQDAAEHIEDADVSQQPIDDCLMVRHMQDDDAGFPDDADSETDVSQNRPRFATEVSQTEGSPLIKQETRNKKQEEEPPTPVPGDGGVELILPKDDLRVDDADFPLALDIAARWVMQKRSLSKRRLQDTIAQQLAMFCRQADRSLQEAAALAVARHEKYEADAPLLRWVYPDTSKIFANNFWCTLSLWPYDQAKIRAAGEAATGMQKPAGRESDEEYRARVVEFMLWNADHLDEIGAPPEISARLRELAAADLPFDELDQQLDDLDTEMVTDAYSNRHPEIVATRHIVETEISVAKGYPEAQISRLRFQVFAGRLYGKHKFPRLTLNRIPRRT